MHQEFVRKQIAYLAIQPAPFRLTDYLCDTCWPSGGADRTLPAALAMASRWRPERTGIDLMACTCATGRCRVCN